MTRESYFAEIDGKEYQIEIISESEVIIDGTPHTINFEFLKTGTSCSLLVDGMSYEPNTFQENGGWEILLEGKRFIVRVEDERERRLRLASGQTMLHKGRIVLYSPMPGLVIDIPVKEGDRVNEGDVLVILESMKMQNELRAPKDGMVSRIEVGVNDNVERKEPLLVLE